MLKILNTRHLRFSPEDKALLTLVGPSWTRPPARIDRFETNEPVTDAAIDGETPSEPVTVAAEGDVYRLDAPRALQPGAHDLIFTVSSGTDIDFLTATLTVPDVAPPQGRSKTRPPTKPSTPRPARSPPPDLQDIPDDMGKGPDGRRSRRQRGAARKRQA